MLLVRERHYGMWEFLVSQLLCIPHFPCVTLVNPQINVSMMWLAGSLKQNVKIKQRIFFFFFYLGKFLPSKSVFLTFCILFVFTLKDL